MTSTIYVDPDDCPSLRALAHERGVTIESALKMLELDPRTATGLPLRPRVAAVFRTVLASQEAS